MCSRIAFIFDFFNFQSVARILGNTFRLNLSKSTPDLHHIPSSPSALQSLPLHPFYNSRKCVFSKLCCQFFFVCDAQYIRRVYSDLRYPGGKFQQLLAPSSSTRAITCNALHCQVSCIPVFAFHTPPCIRPACAFSAALLCSVPPGLIGATPAVNHGHAFLRPCSMRADRGRRKCTAMILQSSSRPKVHLNGTSDLHRNPSVAASLFTFS